MAMAFPMQRQGYTVEEVSQLTGKAIRTIWRWESQGKVHVIDKQGNAFLFDPEEVHALMPTGIPKPTFPTIKEEPRADLPALLKQFHEQFSDFQAMQWEKAGDIMATGMRGYIQMMANALGVHLSVDDMAKVQQELKEKLDSGMAVLQKEGTTPESARHLAEIQEPTDLEAQDKLTDYFQTVHINTQRPTIEGDVREITSQRKMFSRKPRRKHGK